MANVSEHWTVEFGPGTNEARALPADPELAEAAPQAFAVRVRGAISGLHALQIEILKWLACARERLKTNHDDETALEVLPYAYNELPRIRAEITLLSEGKYEDRQAWLEASPEERWEMADRVLLDGG
jgi:hypothetical protein